MSYDIENDVLQQHSWDYNIGHFDFVDKWFLMGSPYPILAIALGYLLVVLKIGPNYMKDRSPFSLNNTLVVYNAVQVIASSYLFYICGELMLANGFVAKTCCLETEENRQKIPTAMYFYFLAKITELLDTVFFVLRKKDNQVTFLHVYHHAMMIVACWSILKYEPTYTSIFIRCINSFVHIVMYGYYGLSAFPSISKYLWWKKYITKMQLIQFGLIMLHFFLTCAASDCRPSYALCLTIFGNTTLFIILFGKFYIDSYSKKNKKKNDDLENKNNASEIKKR